MADIIKVTDCECDIPSACKRHNCRKTQHYWELCQTRRDYFALWEAGDGPGQKVYQPGAELQTMPAQQIRWSIGILDAARSNDVDFCLASLFQNGWDPIFYIDSENPLPESINTRATVVTEAGPPSRWRLFLRCLSDQLTRDQQAEALIVFSAIGDAPRGGRDFIERDLWPSKQTGLVAYFVEPEIDQQKELARMSDAQLAISQGWIFPRRAAELIVSAPEADPSKPMAIGALLKRVLERNSLEAWGYMSGLCDCMNDANVAYNPPDRYALDGTIRRKVSG